MKCVVLTKDSNLEIRESDLPEPQKGCVRVKPKVVGICSSDLPRAFRNAAYTYPLILGHEISGVVDKVGNAVCSVSEGDTVAVFPLVPCFKCEFCLKKKYALCKNYGYFGSRQDGGLQEFLIVPEWNLIKIPNNVDLRDAATLEPTAVMINAFNKSHVLKQKKDAKVLILGSGFLGLILAEIIMRKNSHADLLIVDRNEFKLNQSVSGAKTKCIATTNDAAEFFQQHQSEYDVIFEVTGAPEMIAESIRASKANGEIVLVGNPNGDLQLSKQNLSQILRKELLLFGVWNSNFNPEEINDDWRDAIKFFQEGLSPSKYVSEYIDLDDVPKKIYELENRKSLVKQLIKLSVEFRNK